MKTGTGTAINDKIEGAIVKNIVKNDNIIGVYVKAENYSTELLNKICRYLVDKEMEIKNLVNNSKEDLNLFFTMPKNKFTKFASLIEVDLPMLDCTYKNISRISVIGNGIMSNSVVLKNVLDVLNSRQLDILSMEVNESKISIMFREVISNEILEKLHEMLIEKIERG